MIILEKYWIWFSKINKIGAKAQKELLEKYKNPKAIWNLSKKELLKNHNLNEKQIDIILETENRKNLEKYIEQMKKNRIKMITIKDKCYPEKLRNIYDPPIVLFVKGNEKILNKKSIAIIGSRSCTEYGKKVAERFSYNLSKNNINIISGLANRNRCLCTFRCNKGK